MRLRLKWAALTLCTGVVTLATGACLFRLLGDAVGDNLIFNMLR